MNNYLSSIAARILNPVPPVRPRLRGRFDPTLSADKAPVDQLEIARTTEPLASQAAARTDRPADIEFQRGMRADRLFDGAAEPETSSRRTHESTAHSDSQRLEIKIKEPQSQAPTVEVPITTAAMSKTEPAPQVSAVDAPPAEREQDKASQTPVPAVSRPLTVTSQRPPMTRNEEQHEVKRPKPALEREIKTFVVREGNVIDHSAQSRDAEPSTLPVAPTSIEPKRRDSKPVVVQSRIAPLLEKQTEHLSPARTTTPTEPTIHVTIGRIEVRAVQQSHSSAKPQVTQSVMNLDDYLRRRNQGSLR